MTAARFHAVGQPLALEQVPVPDPGPGEVLVEVRAAGLCGSDVHIAFEGVTPTGFLPITLGHEPCGVVAEVGPDVDGWAPGDRVSVNPILWCAACRTCVRGDTNLCLHRGLLGIHADGALAEFMVAPARNLIALPDAVPFTVGAIVTDAVATPFRALSKTAALRAGETVAIYGVGGLGLHAVQIARLLGARSVIAVDPRATQRERATAAGADVVIDPTTTAPVDAVLDATAGAGVDVAAEFVGLTETIAQCVDSVATGGRVVVAGLGPDPIEVVAPTTFVRKGVALLGSYAFDKGDIAQLVDLVAAGRLTLEDSITHTFPLEDVGAALEQLHTKADDPIRVVVTHDDA